MLRHVALSPVRIVLGMLLGSTLLSLFFFVPIPRSFFPQISQFVLMSLFFLLPIGSMAWVVLGKHTGLQLQSRLLVFVIGILLLYGAFIVWPAYESGLAWYVGDPNKSVVFEDYHVWYIHQYPMDATLFDFISPLLVMATLFASWYILLPLGILLMIIAGRRWSQMQAHERWGSMAISVLAMVVPLVTWTASHQFWRWFID
jgi:hypothetical protein